MKIPVAEIRVMSAEGMFGTEIAKQLNIHRSSVYRALGTHATGQQNRRRGRRPVTIPVDQIRELHASGLGTVKIAKRLKISRLCARSF